MNQPPRILIAGIGNIFFGDDAFGVEVAQRLLARSLPEGVRVVDFGTRGIDLTYALTDDCDIAILVDAVPHGEAPGTLYVIEPELAESPVSAEVEAFSGDAAPLDPHGMDLTKVLRYVSAAGTQVQHFFLVGCEPTRPNLPDDMEMSLSPAVAAAIEPAIVLIESIVAKIHLGEVQSLRSANC